MTYIFSFLDLGIYLPPLFPNPWWSYLKRAGQNPPNPVMATQALNVTVTFDITTGPAPTGTVTFASENTIFGQYTSPITGLTSSTNQFQLLPGTHTIYATYYGDENFSTAEAQLTQVVTPAP